METYLDVLAHVVFSLLAGLIAWKLYGTKNKESLITALIFAFLSGVLIDLDHFIDYFLIYGLHFDSAILIHLEMLQKTGKSYVFFHAYEYVIILSLAALLAKDKPKKLALTALTLGMLFHLGVDILFGVPFNLYFLTFRIVNHFNVIY